jgi:hypothetical protein
MSNTFRDKEIQLIAQLLNQPLAFVAGPELWDHLSSDLIYLAAGETALCFQGDIGVQGFEGFESEYSEILVSPAKHIDLKDDEGKGFCYRTHAGELIEQISIVRDTLNYPNGETAVWNYVTDVAIIFKLETGSLSISKLGYHDELMQVTYFQEFAEVNLPSISGHFGEGANSHIRKGREVIALASAT